MTVLGTSEHSPGGSPKLLPGGAGSNEYFGFFIIKYPRKETLFPQKMKEESKWRSYPGLILLRDMDLFAGK
jgi:hypothetical protein